MAGNTWVSNEEPKWRELLEENLPAISSETGLQEDYLENILSVLNDYKILA
jgi:hypothetical protein